MKKMWKAFILAAGLSVGLTGVAAAESSFSIRIGDSHSGSFSYSSPYYYGGSEYRSYGHSYSRVYRGSSSYYSHHNDFRYPRYSHHYEPRSYRGYRSYHGHSHSYCR